MQAALRRARRDLQTRLDMAAQQQAAPRKVNWGPWEFVQTLCEAADHMRKLQEGDFVLKATLANQLLAFRFDAEGQMISVDQDPLLQAAGLSRNPPTRGLKPALCEERMSEMTTWDNQCPPKPDWTALDSLGDFRQVAPPQGGDNPDDCLDLSLEQLALTDQQKFMLRPISERIKDLAIDQDVKDQVRNHADRAARRRRKVRGRWSSLLAGRMFGKHAHAWRKKLADSGRDVAKFTKSHAPVARGAKALRNLAKIQVRGKKTTAQQKRDPPAVVTTDLKDHPHIGQEARVVAADHQLRGTLGNIVKVYSRTWASGVTPQEFVVMAMKNNVQHLAMDQIMLVRDEAALGKVAPAPIKLNYARFREAAKERHRHIMDIHGRPHLLEWAHHGMLLEMTTVHCGILEILTRLHDYKADPPTMQWLSPSEAYSLAHMDPAADERGNNLEVLTTMRSNLDTATVFFAIQWGGAATSSW